MLGVLGSRERIVPYGYVLFVFGLAGRRRHYRLRSVFVPRGCLLGGLAVVSGVLVVAGGVRPPGSLLGPAWYPTDLLCRVCLLHVSCRVVHVSLAGLGRGLVSGCW